MAKHLKNLASVWNDYRGYPSNYDMERALGKSIRTIRKNVEQYRDIGLQPELIYRDPSGGHVAIPPSVQNQLNEFRFDPDNLTPNGFIVTSAQYGAPLNTWVWQSLKNYAEYRGMSLIVLPIKYGSVKTVYQKGERRLTSTFPDELKGHIAFDDIEVGWLRLSTARLRPTLQKFLTDSVCEIGGNKSVIFAAPVLELEHRPRVGKSYPKAVMTTGAVSYPNYQTDNLGQQDRTGLLAAKNHAFSAIIVETDKDQFHFRQLHSNKRGEFYDITRDGVVFCKPKGVSLVFDAVEAVICGDWHTGKTCPKTRKATLEGMLPLLKPKNLVLHDFLDGDSITHHGERERTRKGYGSKLGWLSLETEIANAEKELKHILSLTTAQVHLIPSNHPEFVVEWLESGRWIDQPENSYIGAELFVRAVRDLRTRKPAKVNARATDPVAMWFREKFPEVNVVERKQTLLMPKGKNSILLSLHGDIGMRGNNTRGLAEFRKMNKRVILGHNHSGAILGPVWRVGTSTPLMQFYVQNPVTNWTNTHCVVFKNGQRQLLNIVNGKFLPN